MKDWEFKEWVIVLAFAVFSGFLLFAVLQSASAAPAPKARGFDHSQCQYPNRETNPPNGCDNSDPACPETIKYGYDCEEPTIPEPVAEIPMSQNVETVDFGGK